MMSMMHYLSLSAIIKLDLFSEVYVDHVLVGVLIETKNSGYTGSPAGFLVISDIITANM